MIEPERGAIPLQVLRRSARLDRVAARAPRHLFTAGALILALLGLRALFSPGPAAEPVVPQATLDHPSEDFAERFARAYLTADPSRPGLRERQLRPLAPEGLDLELGAQNKQRVLWTQVAQNQEALAGGRIVVVAAQLNAESDPLYLAVPVVRDRTGAVGLAGYPALVGAPTVSLAAPADRVEVDDAQIVPVVRRAMTNYLAGEPQNLSADLLPTARVSLPTRELQVLSVDEVAWTHDEGSSAVLITVVARDREGLEWTLSYEVGIDLGGARPYVSFIETVPNAP